MCVCCRYTCVHVNVKGQPWVSFLRMGSTLFIEISSLTGMVFRLRLGWSNSEPLESSSLCRPGVGVMRAPPLLTFYMWILEIDLRSLHSLFQSSPCPSPFNQSSDIPASGTI